MAKAYWVGFYKEIINPDAMPGYAALAGPAIAQAGGRFLARGGKVQPYEAGIDQRTVIVEFYSFEAAVAAYESDAYQEEALAALGAATVRDVRIVEGLDG
jgi:uncharacterized protein (DUF1330 family)